MPPNLDRAVTNDRHGCDASFNAAGSTSVVSLTIDPPAIAAREVHRHDTSVRASTGVARGEREDSPGTGTSSPPVHQFSKELKGDISADGISTPPRLDGEGDHHVPAR